MLMRGLSLNKEVEKEPDICRRLQFEDVRGIERLQFLLVEYRFSKDSEGGGALIVSLPWPLSPLSLMFHIVKTRALTLVGLPCYYVKLRAKTVGLWAVQEHHDSLFVASLSVAKEYRRLGLGTCILKRIESIARRMGKSWMEVDVLKKNIPAQRLYTKYGFKFEDEKMHGMIRGKKPL
jgi:ribosomal protein S18 acetylase RimI-like enzyme